MIELGECLCRLRKEMHMTQEQLAFKAGLSVRTVQRIESTECVDMNLKSLRAYCDAISVPLEATFVGILKAQGGF